MVRISATQMFWLISTSDIGITLLLTFSSVIKEARQDAWMSFLIAGIATMAIMAVTGKSSLLYPNQTLVQTSQTVLGKWLGKAIIMPYLVFWCTVTPVLLRSSVDFIHITLLTETPLIVLTIGIMSVVVYVTSLSGLEGIARCSEVMGPIVFTMIVVVLVLTVTNVDVHQLLPVYRDVGWGAIIKGAVTPYTFLSSCIMFTPFMLIPEKGIVKSIWAVGFTCAIVTLALIVTLGTFGPTLCSRMLYSFFSATKFVNLMEFIQNINILIMVIWICSLFIRLSLFLFILSYTTAQWLHITNWRMTLWFTCPMVFVAAMIPSNGLLLNMHYDKKFVIPYMVPTVIVIPLLVWGVGTIRKRQARR